MRRVRVRGRNVRVDWTAVRGCEGQTRTRDCARSKTFNCVCSTKCTGEADHRMRGLDSAGVL
eukprot:3524949-Rhodomonas_salina.1